MDKNYHELEISYKFPVQFVANKCFKLFRPRYNIQRTLIVYMMYSFNIFVFNMKVFYVVSTEADRPNMVASF